MATIREELELVDRFSATFTSYLNYGNKAAQASTMAQNAAQNYQSVLNSLDRKLITLNAQFAAHTQEQNAMLAAGKQNTEAFSALDARMEKLGSTIRTLTTQYDLVEKEATEAARAAEEFSASNQAANSSSAGLTSGLKGLIGSYAGIQGLKLLGGTSDAIASANARLDMMNDGLQTTQELNDMIFASANRSRGAYQATADMVAKLGTLAGGAFDSSQEIVAFAEQLNKQMVLSATTTAGSQAAMLQLTQAMSSGVLRGEELNTILEQTPSIAQAIAGYIGVSTGEMRELASQGAITADVVKSALFSAADETNARFEQMPMTWGQVWTMFQNYAQKALTPILALASLVAQHMDVIGPIVLGIAGALIFLTGATAAYNAVKSITNTLSAISAARAAIEGGATLAQAAATTTATGAQVGLNAALLACPVTWIVMGIMLIVGVLYAAVAAYNKFTDSSVSATGIIAGAVATVGAFIANTIIGMINSLIQTVWSMASPIVGVVEWILNVTSGGFDSFGDAAANLIGNIISWFLDLGKIVTRIIDAIFGTNWTDGLNSLQQSVLAWGKNENAITISRDAPQIDYRINYGDAYNAGYNWGSGLFGSGMDFDYSKFATDVSGLSSDVSDIKGSVSMSEENLKALVDMAERQYVNNINLTTRAPVINIHGQNTGNSLADTRALMDTMTRMLAEQTASSASLTTAQAF